ncbi:hypothetical protein CIB48_g11835 [Xylaria polymorpha]|nr:hypothetical protein CIB48_g11835 [Xylaria polymorpha]
MVITKDVAAAITVEEGKQKLFAKDVQDEGCQPAALFVDQDYCCTAPLSDGDGDGDDKEEESRRRLCLLGLAPAASNSRPYVYVCSNQLTTVTRRQRPLTRTHVDLVQVELVSATRCSLSDIGIGVPDDMPEKLLFTDWGR